MAAHPNPVFEGSEKRLEVDFSPSAASPEAGLRTLPRPQLDQLLAFAECCIVSGRSNASFDAYVLSESSLFVYPTKLVLKTCGSTKPLSAVPCLLDYAAGLGLAVRRCKYSRASFLFPEAQPTPHQSFPAEVAHLQAHFGHLGARGAYVLGDALNGLQWHVFVAGDHAVAPAPPTYTLEICMTELCATKAGRFHRLPDFVSAAITTRDSGIGALFPNAEIDDYVFEPCGYSMNGIDGAGFSTIHITPEPGCSYASLEVSACGEAIDAPALIAQAAKVFAPGKMAVALSVDQAVSVWPWNAAPPPAPPGYACHTAAAQSVPGSGRTAFFGLAQASPSAIVASEAQDDNPLPTPLALELQRLARAAAGSADVEMAASELSDASATTRPPSPLWDLAASVLAADPPSSSTLPPAALPPAAALARVLAACEAEPLRSGSPAALDAHFASLIAQHRLEDPIFVYDLGLVVRLHAVWCAAFPRVAPHYAVKCNGNRGLLGVLAALGAGFDCATDAEMETVLGLGVAPERIVYANACKRPRDIRAAAAKAVCLTTFDTACELAKLAHWHPATRALLRLRADDPSARCPLGNKYGAELADTPALLQAARDLGIAVTGVSFHVGSGATNPEAFSQAIALARKAFDIGLALGHDMHVLDIGGGFAGGPHGPNGAVALGGVAKAVNAALEEHFPLRSHLRIIAEPGRYFAESCATLACMVYGERSGEAANGSPSHDYWITDGLYGAFNSVLYDHAVLTARPLLLAPNRDRNIANPGGEAELISSTVFGPTCDGLDTVLRCFPLPRLACEDWLVFPAMGAYTTAGASAFNGFDSTVPTTFYVFSEC